MDSAYIKNSVDEICGIMLSAGMPSPRVMYWVESNVADKIVIFWKPVGSEDAYRDETKMFYGDDILGQALAWASALPSRDEVQRNNFMKLVAAAIDYGNDTGIETEFLNPLTAMMKKLSENAIEHKPEE